jgi:mannose-6-phosphate isomerase
MTGQPLYPLRFEPIFQYRLWGGRRLGAWLKTSLPEGPIGEAWVLSDREDHATSVADGPLKGCTIAQLMVGARTALLGDVAERFQRFPLLLKFLDVRAMLSVQVHPRDDQSLLIPKGESGKTEAWVVLEADPGSRIYVGLKPGTTAQDLRELTKATAEDHLASFAPGIGQGVLIDAGTVHALGDGLLVFEVQENSDVTFRVYDWDHTDQKTGRARELQVEKALACIDLRQGAVPPVTPCLEAAAPVRRERLFDNAFFRLWRHEGTASFEVGAAGEPRILVCVEGGGDIEYVGEDYPMARGAVTLLPASLGVCRFRPLGRVSLLQIGVAGPP